MRRLVAAVLAFFFTACACGGERPLCVVGSSSMGKALRTLAAASPYPIEVQLGGTQQGLAALAEGRADLAACSRALTPADGEVEPTVLALDAIAVVVNDENPFTAIDSDVLRAVYEGEITDWNTLGCTLGRIVVIGRETGSGTRASFENAIGIRKPAHGQELGEDGIVCTAVSSCPRAIGYVSAACEAEGIHPLLLDGSAISQETVQSGTYPLVRPFLLCADGTDERAEAFLVWATGEEGRTLLRSIGLFEPQERQ